VNVCVDSLYAKAVVAVKVVAAKVVAAFSASSAVSIWIRGEIKS
jgi:hypothetical protein